MKGTIVRLTDRGFGFITPAEGGDKDLFFHARSLEGVEYDSLKEGDAVLYDIEDGDKGPAAINVRLGSDAPAAANDAEYGADDQQAA